MKLELDLSFLYGSTILPECILIIYLIIILILDLISKERDTSLLYFISFRYNKYWLIVIPMERETYY
jgi:hypothetical protein